MGMKVVPDTRHIQVKYIPAQPITCFSHNRRRISDKCAAIEAEAGSGATGRKYSVLMVAFVAPVDSSPRSDQNQRWDKLVILNAYTRAGRPVWHHLNRPVHCRAVNQAVIINNRFVRKI